MGPFQESPPEFSPFLQDGAAIAHEALARFGALTPMAVTLRTDGASDIVGGWGGGRLGPAEAMERVYGALRAQAEANEIRAAAVFSEGEDVEGRELLVCFAEHAETGAFRAGAILTWRRAALSVFGLTLRRGIFDLDEDVFRPLDRRLWT